MQRWLGNWVLVSCLMSSISTLAVADEIVVGGRVLVPGGAPLPEAEVLLLPLTDDLTEAQAAFAGEATEPAARGLSDAEGRFRLPAPGPGLWRVRVQAPGFVPLEAALTPLIEPVLLDDAELSTDVGLVVKVVDGEGQPLAGARVRLGSDLGRYDFGRTFWRAPTRYAETAEDGTVRLSRGERERGSVAATKAGHRYELRRGVHGTAVTLRVGGGALHTIEVVSSSAEPIRDVVVMVGTLPIPVGRTDEQGRIRLSFPKGAPLELSLLAADGRRSSSRVDAPPADAERPRAITLADRQAISGKLIDALSRRPVAGGIVWDANNPLTAAVADRAGGFVMTGPDGKRLEIAAGAPGYMNAHSRQVQLGGTSRVGPTLALRPAAVIEGKVVDATGAPVARAEVEIEVRRNPGSMRIEIGGPPKAGPRATTGEKGAFRLSPIDPEQNYTVKVRAEGFAPGEKTVNDLEPYRVRSGVRVELDRGQRLTGRVVDVEEHPVAEVKVSLAPARKGGGMLRLMAADDPETFETTTDSEGRFELGGLPQGAFDLEAKRSGFAPTAVSTIEIKPADEPLDVGDVVLEAGVHLGGVVLDDAGQPIEGAEVFVDEAGGGMTLAMAGLGGSAGEPDAVTDPGGWFQVVDLDGERPYNLRVRRSGFVEKTKSGLRAPPTEPLEVRLDAASDVSGLVLDDEGEPIVGAEVSLSRAKTLEMGGAVMQTMMRSSEVTDYDGRFLFEDQEPGKISLTAVASGWQEGKLSDVEVPKGEDVLDLEIPLEAGSILEGHVRAPDGSPAVGAVVNKVSGESSPMARFGGEPADGEGYYRIEGLTPGTVSVQATHESYPRVVKDTELNEGLNSLDLDFTGGQEVSGHVTDTGGSPVGAATVRLVTAGALFGGPETSTSQDGSFSVPGVQDGDYDVWVESEGYAPSTGETRITVAGEPLRGVRVELDPGSAILGQINGVEPEDYSRISVTARGETFLGLRDGARVDYQGAYRIDHLTPGPYTVVAQMEGTGKQTKGEVTIEPGASEVRLDLEFGGGVTLSGRALQGERPIAGAMIYVSGVEIDHSGWNQTDEDGKFEIEGLEPGRYRVQLQAWQTGLSYRQEVDIAASREIVLEVPTSTVGGTVVDSADEQPLAGVKISLVPADPDQGATFPGRVATTDVEGRFLLDSVGDGNWRLAAEKQGYAAQTRTVQVQFERDVADLELKMDPTEGLVLEARLPSGAIPDELRVAVLDPQGSALTSGNYATGERGRVRLASIPPGTWELLVSGPGSAVSAILAQSPGSALPVQLEPACNLEVTVPGLVGSGEVAQVSLVDSSGRPFRTLSWSGEPRSQWRMTGGKAEFASLPPDEWTVRVTAPDGRAWEGRSVTFPGRVASLIME